MRKRANYQQMSNFAIATEILADDEASIREKVLAQRIRKFRGDDGSHRDQHAYD